MRRSLSVVLAVTAVLLASFAGSARPAEAAPWLTGYGFQRTITVDHTKVGGTSDLTNYPLLVSLTSASLATVANGGEVTNANGYDIAFTASDGTTVLDHEIESYNATTGAIVMWVRIPTLSYTAATAIYMYYGNAGVTTSQEDVVGVWDANYTGVWHMDESSGTTNADSTSNAGTATKVSSSYPAPLATAKVGAGQSFNQSAGGESISGTANDLTGDRTVEAWIRLTNFAPDSGNVSQRFLYNYIDANNFFQLVSDDTNGLVFAVRRGGAYNMVDITGLSTATWYHVVGTFRASDNAMTLTVNTAVDGTTSAAWPGTVATTGLRFGSRSDNSGRINAAMDEIRLSNAVRSAGWITTTYNNQNDAATFFALGAEVEGTPTDSEAVTLTGTINPTLTFTVAGRGTACNSQSAANFQTGSTATTVSLGVLSGSTVNGAAQDLTLSTNAGDGFVVYIRTTGTTPDAFRTASGNVIADVSGTHALPSDSSAAGTAAFGYTTGDASVAFGANKWAKLTSVDESVMVGAAGVTSKSSCVGFQATIANTTIAGTYTVPIVYTAVPTF